MTSPRTQKKILIIIIALLVIANAVTLFKLAERPEAKMKSGKRGEMTSYLAGSVKYSEDQLKRYKALREQHEKEADKLFSEIRKEKERRLQQLSLHNFNDTSILLHADSMMLVNRNVELLMMRHLRDVRNIGSEKQRAIFDSTFVKYLADRQKKKKTVKH